ncbi:MAG TPA: hypothetical protein VFI34_03705 [Candidatus Limnocylindrales bacterium]|nr:hypothetical protein [Candidatus Limnocylindrales bacterium]
MIVGLGFLALFFALSTVLGDEDPRHNADPRDNLAYWMRFGIR